MASQEDRYMSRGMVGEWEECQVLKDRTGHNRHAPHLRPRPLHRRSPRSHGAEGPSRRG